MTETGSGHPPGQGWWVSQDPTELTNQAVGQAKDDLRRELTSMQQLLSERILRTETILRDLDVRNKAEITDSVNALEAILSQRIAGLEKIMKLLDQTLNRGPEQADDLRERLQTDIATAVDNLKHLHEERFRAIDLQFNERDVRGDQEKKASKEALDAALLAQKESVAQQNDANTTAANLAGSNSTKQIDLVGTQITALDKSLTDRISELKERIDRGEGQDRGTAVQRTDQRASIGTVIAAVATLVAVISFVLYVVKK
jgi:predicted transcriptional regulator